MNQMYIIAGYARPHTIMQNVKFLPRYGVFTTKRKADVVAKALNKRSARGDIYFSVPVDVDKKLK